jgi:hypothetical protein
MELTSRIAESSVPFSPRRFSTSDVSDEVIIFLTVGQHADNAKLAATSVCKLHELERKRCVSNDGLLHASARCKFRYVKLLFSIISMKHINVYLIS